MLELLQLLDKETVSVLIWFVPTLFFIYLLFRVVIEPAVRLFAKMVSVNDACAEKIEELRREMQVLQKEFQYLKDFCLNRGRGMNVK